MPPPGLLVVWCAKKLSLIHVCGGTARVLPAWKTEGVPRACGDLATRVSPAAFSLLRAQLPALVMRSVENARTALDDGDHEKVRDSCVACGHDVQNRNKSCQGWDAPVRSCGDPRNHRTIQNRRDPMRRRFR